LFCNNADMSCNDIQFYSTYIYIYIYIYMFHLILYKRREKREREREREGGGEIIFNGLVNFKLFCLKRIINLKKILT